MRVEVEGRFSMEREAALNDRHRMAAIQEAQEQMIAGQEKLGSKYLGEDFVVKGPFKHIAFDDSSRPDRGPMAQPDPRDIAAMRRYREHEQARIARKPGERRDLVDYVLTTAFAKKMNQQLLPIAPSLGLKTTQSGLIVPAHA